GDPAKRLLHLPRPSMRHREMKAVARAEDGREGLRVACRPPRSSWVRATWVRASDPRHAEFCGEDRQSERICGSFASAPRADCPEGRGPARGLCSCDVGPFISVLPFLRTPARY